MITSHIRHNLVAYVALFFALGGSAIAAKPLLTGADVQDDSLTGADVLEASLGDVPRAGFAFFASAARNAGAVNRVVASGLELGPLVESSVFGVEIAGGCGGLRVSGAPGRQPPEAVYGYSFGDNDESGFFEHIPSGGLTLENEANLILSLVVERDAAFARVEVVKRGCEFTGWITRSEDDDGL